MALLLANAAKAAKGTAAEQDLLVKASKQLQLGWNKLQAARQLLDDFTNEDKVRFLVECVSYTIQSQSLCDADFRLKSPQSLLDGRKAVSIAAQLESSRENKLLSAQANGWAGVAASRYSMLQERKVAVPLEDESEKHLISALKALEGDTLASPDSASTWRWAHGLAWVYRKRLGRLERGTPEYKTVWNASVKQFQAAYAQCDDASDKAQIRDQWNEVFRAR